MKEELLESIGSPASLVKRNHGHHHHAQNLTHLQTQETIMDSTKRILEANENYGDFSCILY